jgi:hypothetical protein
MNNKSTMGEWRMVESGFSPEGIFVMTKIEDKEGTRNQQPMRRQGRLWFTKDGVYVYYTPTMWRPLTPQEHP